MSAFWRNKALSGIRKKPRQLKQIINNPSQFFFSYNNHIQKLIFNNLHYFFIKKSNNIFLWTNIKTKN